MSENPLEILRDWAQEPENIETIAQAVQALQKSVTQLNAHLSSAASVSVSSAAPSVPALASTTPLPQNLGNLWIVGPNPTSTTIVLRYIGEPNEPLTLSTGIQNLLIGGILLFLSGPAQGYPTIITAVASDGTLTFDPVDHTPNPGDRFVFLSNFAATPGSAYTPGQQGSLPPGGNNTVTIPSGVTVNLDIPGQYANNTIVVNANGTGLPTTIQVGSMVGCNLNITEGDTVKAHSMTASSIVSNNSAGGLTATTNPDNASISFSSPGTSGGSFSVTPAGPYNYAYIYLQAGASGTFSLTISTSSDGDNGYWQIDNGAQTDWSVSRFGSTSFTGVAVPIGSHILTIYFASTFDDLPNYFTVTVNDFSAGNIVTSLGAPSYFRANNMVNAGVILNGDTVTVDGNDVMNSQIENQGGGTNQGSTITITGNITDSDVFYSSVVNLLLGTLSDAKVVVNGDSPASITVNTIQDATVTVPANVGSQTTINYTGTITEDLTTTATQTTYVGTDLIAGYTAPSSDPSIVLSTTVEPTGVLYVPAGNVVAYTTLTDEGVIRVAGKLVTNSLSLAAGAQLIVDADAVVELGAFN